MTCRKTPFVKEPPGFKIQKSVSECCEDIPASALVYYNALYCHPASAMFSALPTGIAPPCAEIGDPNAPPLDPIPPPDPANPPPPDAPPPVSDPPPVTPPPTEEPPPVVPPSDPPSDPPPPVEAPPDIPPPPDTVPATRIFMPDNATDFKAALTGALPGDIIIPAQPAQTQYFIANAETGSLNQWSVPWGTPASAFNGTITVSSEVVKSGTYSYKFEVTSSGQPSEGAVGHSLTLMRGDPTVTMGSPNGRFLSGVYEFDAYIDAGYTGAAETGAWNLTLGWMTGVTGAPSPICDMGIENWGGIPQITFQLKNAVVGLYTPPTIVGYNTNGGNYRMSMSSPAGIKPFPRKEWVHVKIEYTMAASNGRVKIYQRNRTDISDVLIMDLTAPTFNTFGGATNAGGQLPLTNVAGDMMIQFGIYGGPQIGVIQRLYADNFAVKSFAAGPATFAFGSFTLTGVNGTADNPIVIDGQNGLVTITCAAGQHIEFDDCSYIQFINNVKFSGGQFGPRFSNCHHIVFETDIGNVLEEGCAVINNSHHIWFQHIHVHDTGLGTPNNGQGFSIGDGSDVHDIYWSDFLIEKTTAQSILFNDDQIHDCKFSIPAKVIGTLTQYVPGTIEELVKLRGDNHVVDGISLIKGAPHCLFIASGDGTVVRNCASDVQDIHSLGGTRYAYKVAGGATNVTIACSNKAQNGDFSNITCTDENAVPLPPVLPDNSLPTALAPAAPAFLRTRTASNVSDLVSYLSSALPGDLILLLGITYNVAASLNSTIAGTLAHPITVRGVGSGSIVNVGSNQTWHVKAPYWRFENFRMTNAFYAFFTGVDQTTGPGAPNCVWHQMEIDHCQQEGILLQHGSVGCYVQLSTFHDLGIASAAFGEAVYVGGYGTPTTDCKVLQNKMGPLVRAEAVDVSQGSDRTIVEGNDINCQTVSIVNQTNSPVCVRGIDCQITSNNIVGGAPHGIDVYTVAQGTVLRNNRIQLNSNGFGIRINGAQGTIKVYCDNVVTNIQSGGQAYNVACTPLTSPPPPTTTFRYPRGLITKNTEYGEPLIDFSNTNPNGFPAKLQQARTNKKRCGFKLFSNYPSQQTQAGDPELNPANALYDPTAVIGGWSQRRAKANISNAQNIMPDVRSYVNDGTFIFNMLGDDITSGARGLWNGRVPTGAELDDLAKHSKSVTGWSTLPCAFRLPAEYLKQIEPVGGYKYVDFAWNQLPFGGTTDIYGYIQKAYLNALSIKLGIMVGGNLLDGGAGPNSPDGWALRGNRQNKYGMSPTEIIKLGDAILSLGDLRTLGCFFWTDVSYYPPGGTQAQLMAYWNRTDIQAALTNFSNKVKNVKIGPINYR